MSQLFKTNLEEYARQCTIQRRRYEECLQQVQQSVMIDSPAMSTDAATQNAESGESVASSQLDACMEQAVQNCMIDLLEMPAHLLGWDDDEAVADDVRAEVIEQHQRHDDRAQAPYQTRSRQTSMNPPFVNPTPKSPSPVGFGAP